jgi:hypothetical protein
MYGDPIDFLAIDFLKILKASVAGGIICGAGSWCIYYYHYRSYK